MRVREVCFIVSAALLGACGPSGQRWVGELPASRPIGADDAWKSEETPATSATASDGIEITEVAGTPRAIIADGEAELFRNTYYDFPRDAGGDLGATIFDAACAPIAKVSRRFHDQVCVQGSGRLASGQTVSFAKRDCACAAVCPRTAQKICFERLDPARFPHGRGATGRAIAPLRTVAVDPAVIPLGTSLFVPEYVGLPRPDGSAHDGCFLAEDRGLKVVGRHIDVFTGDPAVTVQWNQLLPSNRGVHVRVGDPRCGALNAH
jgi:3D (Asp-Asp-Asp) domain-containing protein